MESHPSSAGSWGRRAFELAGYLLCLFLFGFSIYCIHTCTVHMGNALPGPGWAYPYSELLISYDQGYVRRGLLGEFIRRIAGGGPAMHVANEVLFTNFVLLAVSLAILAIKRVTFRPWNLLFVLIMPGSLLCMALGGGFWCRKEALFYTALALTGLAVSALRAVQQPATRKVLSYLVMGAVFLVSTALMLVHEGFLFMAAPAFTFMLIAMERSLTGAPGHGSIHKRRSISKTYVLLMCVLFVAIMGYGGHLSGSDTMWQHLNPSDRTELAVLGNHGAFDNMLQGMVPHIMQPVHRLVAGLAWFWVVPIFGLMLYCLALVSLNLGSRTADGERVFDRWLACHIVLTAAILPLFVIALDWGRWVAAANLSFIILWLSVRNEDLAIIDWRAVPSRLVRAKTMEALVSRVKHAAAYYLEFTLRHKGLVVTIMFLFATSFRLPESWVGEYDTDNYALALALEYGGYLVNHGIMHVFHIHSLGSLSHWYQVGK